MGQIDEVTSVTRDMRLRGAILVKAIEEEKSGAQLNLGFKNARPQRARIERAGQACVSD